MVWLYGGAFAAGAGSEPSYSGAGLAQKGAVVVTLNYRLGVFGLLAHPELTKESGHSASGNYALLDQIAALRWVKANIAAFGGDPERVTIFGQSAGSISIALLLTSPLANRLFQRAIGESDFLFGTGAGNAETRRFVDWQTLREAEQQGVEFGKKSGATTLAALRAMPADELLKASNGQFRPIADGYVVPNDIHSVYSGGKQIKVPVLVGSVANERENFPHPRSMQDYASWTRRQFPDAFDEVMGLLPANNDEEATRAYLVRERDIMAADLRTWAVLTSRSGQDAYLFYFTRKPPARAGEMPLGAVHTADIVYFRNTLDTVNRPWTLQDRKLADVMSSYLVNFAATGNPNATGLPNWPAYRAGEIMELGDNVGPIPTPDARELVWLDQYIAKQLAPH
jgi:para-nitrobenzyl esterase